LLFITSLLISTISSYFCIRFSYATEPSVTSVIIHFFFFNIVIKNPIGFVASTFSKVNIWIVEPAERDCSIVAAAGVTGAGAGVTGATCAAAACACSSSSSSFFTLASAI
jgi:hypothetical protein